MKLLTAIAFGLLFSIGANAASFEENVDQLNRYFGDKSGYGARPVVFRGEKDMIFEYLRAKYSPAEVRANKYRYFKASDTIPVDEYSVGTLQMRAVFSEKILKLHRIGTKLTFEMNFENVRRPPIKRFVNLDDDSSSAAFGKVRCATAVRLNKISDGDFSTKRSFLRRNDFPSSFEFFENDAGHIAFGCRHDSSFSKLRRLHSSKNFL